MPFYVLIIVAVVCIVVTALVTSAVRKNTIEKKVGNAEEKAREIIDDALKVAERSKREALLEAKEESLKTKNELEKETKERRAELQRYERRVLAKEETLDKKSDAVSRAMRPRKRSWQSRLLRSISFRKKEYRNWKESLALPPNRQKNIY